jgi:mono/diheme cytochrome c family protein
MGYIKQYARNWAFAAVTGIVLAGLPSAAFAEDGETKIDYKTLTSPVANTEISIKRGRSIYMRYCTACHGADGKAQIDVVADATNLTDPKRYLSGSTEGEIFRSIKEGAGVSMPPFAKQIKREDDMWHMVNFIRSLWPADVRPELEEEDTAAKDGAEQSGEDGGES